MGRRKSDRAMFRGLVMLSVLLVATSALASYVSYRALCAMNEFDEAMREISRAASADIRHRGF